MVTQNFELAYFLPHTRADSIPMDWVEQMAERGIKFNLYVIWSQDAAAQERVEQLKRYEHVNVELLNLQSVFRIPRLFVSLELIARQLAPSISVIHTHHVLSDLLGWYLATRLGVPHIITNHSDYDSMPYHKKIEKRITMKNSVSVFNSKATKKSYESLLPKTDNTHVIYNGINASKIDTLVKNKENSSLEVNFELNVIVAARFTSEKDILTTVKAFDDINETENDIGLHLVGDGSQKSDIVSYISDREINNVQYYGYLPRDSVFELMLETDVFVLSSHHEGFCNALVEAMYCENAVVSTEIEPIKTEITGGDALYFEPGDHDQLVDHLLTLKSNSQLRQEIRSKMKNRAKKLALIQSTEDYLSVYNECSE